MHTHTHPPLQGFTSLVNQLQPSQVMLFLNSLYSVWDSLLESFGVYKVETIGGECVLSGSVCRPKLQPCVCKPNRGDCQRLVRAVRVYVQTFASQR